MKSNAIIMASGLGSRMRPLTLNTPKPLLKARDVPLIETVINALNKINVDDIYIVVGYLAEQFDYLKTKYPNVKLIKNNYYNEINNISSIYVAKDVLLAESCFICEADLFVSNASFLNFDNLKSGYFGKYIKGLSEDWVFELDDNYFIKRVGKRGNDCFNMVGFSYFTKEDAQILHDCIASRFGTKGYENLFWDDVVNENLDKLKLVVHPVDFDSITELDTVEEFNNFNNKQK